MEFTQLRERIQRISQVARRWLDVNDCVLCQSSVESGHWLRLLCETCYGDLDILPLGQDLLFDHPKWAAGLLASNCDGMAVIGKYDWPLSRLIQGLKYHKHLYKAELLGRLLAAQLDANAWPGIDGICPLPLHPSRQRARGYNQSQLLSRVIAKALGLKMCHGLIRVKPTASQAKLNRRERQGNVKQAFDVVEDYLPHVRGKTILLVDDVITTGATVDQASQALKLAGAAAVYVAAAAIQPYG